MTNELTFKQWHHGYLGLLLIVLGVSCKSKLLVGIGVFILVDDLFEHAVQYLLDPTFKSPLRCLYGLLYARATWVRKVNLWLDRLFS